jgi:TPR repeat protein
MLETQKPVQTASTAPSREDIANAYQSALQTRAPLDVPASPSAEPAAAAPAPVASSPASITAPGAASAIVTPPFGAVAVGAPPPQQHAVRRMDPDELAGLMRRAKTLLAAGDIPPARLLLERAADAQEPAAALMLAQTYDAQVLGTRDVRNINADPNAARNWYRRAAQLGSTEAQRRLNQLQN